MVPFHMGHVRHVHVFLLSVTVQVSEPNLWQL